MPHYFQQYLFILVYTVGGFSIGLLFEKKLLSLVAKLALTTKWKYDDILVKSFRRVLTWWITLMCFFTSVNYYSPHSPFIALANKICFSIFVLTITILVVRVLVGIIKAKTVNQDGAIASSSIITNITSVIVFLIGILVILQTLGISITPVLTALGVGGLAVALALQDTLTNLFSGIQVIASQQLKTGDFIKLDTGEDGFITDITWRNTTIRAMQNNLIIIPNSKLASAIIRNYQLPDKEIGLPIEVGVSYDSDLDSVEQITKATAIEILKTIEGGVIDFEPTFRYHTFADSSINFTITLRVNEYTNQFVVKHEFIKALHKNYQKHNIEIPFPIRTVVLKKILKIR